LFFALFFLGSMAGLFATLVRAVFCRFCRLVYCCLTCIGFCLHFFGNSNKRPNAAPQPGNLCVALILGLVVFCLFGVRLSLRRALPELVAVTPPRRTAPPPPHENALPPTRTAGKAAPSSPRPPSNRTQPQAHRPPPHPPLLILVGFL